MILESESELTSISEDEMWNVDSTDEERGVSDGSIHYIDNEDREEGEQPQDVMLSSFLCGMMGKISNLTLKILKVECLVSQMSGLMTMM